MGLIYNHALVSTCIDPSCHHCATNLSPCTTHGPYSCPFPGSPPAIESMLDKLRARLNRRLKKLAKWSDEKLDDRLPMQDRQRRVEIAYKQPITVQKTVTTMPAKSFPAHTELPSALKTAAESEKAASAQVTMSLGSENNYIESYSEQVQEVCEQRSEAKSYAAIPRRNSNEILK
jgi:hypothetical protein